LRVLTFNSHQPYLHLLAAALPWTLGVVTPRLPSGSVRDWDPRIRPLPSNIRLYTSVREALQDAHWDWILTHNVNDLIDVREIKIPKAFLVHGTLSGRILQDRTSIDRSIYVRNLQYLLAAGNSRVVYISELKRQDWGMPGEVIRPGIDIHNYGGYRGNICAILQVCNHLKERGPITGWDAHLEVCRDLPHIVLGNNKSLPLSRIANSWEDLKEQMRSYRVYLYTPVYPYEDGYNLALLEAMATGMPIATLHHGPSPVHDGTEGITATTAGELRGKIIRLLDDPGEAARLGHGARIRVEKEFPLSEFQRAWQSFADRLTHPLKNR
jgi:glycosyltransferase involved in cell wall biosynthesis